MGDYGKFLEGIDEVEESYGFTNDPLPKGQYPMEVLEIQDQGVTKNDVPFAKVHLRVIEGPYTNRRVFESIYFGAAATKGVKDGDQFVRVERTGEEYAKAHKSTVGRAKGWVKALGVGHESSVTGDGIEAVFTYYRVASWQGSSVMCDIAVDGDNNRITAFAAIDDDKKGIANWRTKELPKQLGAKGVTSSVPGRL